MRIYRTPIYLDKEILTPVANQLGIEVDTNIEITATDRTSKRRGLNAGGSIPGAMGARLDLGKDTEGEVAHSRVIKAHPGAALNELLDRLHESDSLITDLESDTVVKSALVELEADWEISPVTETGALIRSMIQLLAANPQALHADELPMDIAASLISPETSSNRKIVLTRCEESQNETKVVVLLDSGLLANNHSEDDLEDDKTILGLVETFKPEGKAYSLESFLSGGIGRALRRQLSAHKIYESLGALYESDFSEQDLKVDGPVVVLRAIAVYP